MANRADPISELELRHELVQETADFARAYLRWMDASDCERMSYPRLRLLEQLHCVGPDRMGALGDELGLTPRNMTALVDALEQEGLVARRAHPSDRRAVLVELTEAGLRTAEELLEPRIKELTALFDTLEPAERERFLAAVRTLLDALRDRGVRV
jgi:DNA-binding MarR family transcriptional regulator